MLKNVVFDMLTVISKMSIYIQIVDNRSHELATIVKKKLVQSTDGIVSFPDVHPCTLGNVKSGRMRLCIRLALVYVPDHVVWSGT